MPNRKSTQMRLLLFTITLVLVALCAVAVVSAAGGEPAQHVTRGAPETGDRAKVTLLGPAFWLAGQEEAGLAATSNLADPTTLAVTIVSSPWALLDHNNPATKGPHVLVVEAMISNTGDTTATLPIVTLDYNEDPANNWVLLPGEDPVRKIPELPAGEVYHAYWLATYPSVIGRTHVYTVAAQAQNAAPVSTSQNAFRPTAATVETRRALEGGSTRLQETTSDIIVGYAFTTTVEWDLGSNFNQVLLSPAGNVDFDLSSYRLVASRVTFLQNSTPLQTTLDRLYFATVPALTTNARGEFVFEALRPLPTRICPYTSPLFSSDFKYDNAYCEPGLAIEGTVSLSMTKQVSAADILQNELLTYTITFTNNGNLPLGNVWIWDEVDPADGSVVLSSIDPPGNPAWTNDQRVAWQVGGIAPAGQPGSTGTLTFAIDVNGGGNDLLDQHKIVNDVFFGVSSVDLPTYAALTRTVTTTVQAPTITVAKTDGLETVNAGEELTYTLRITNTGSVTATNVVVTDLLPSGVSYTGGPSPSWNLDPIPPSGGYRVITVPVTVAPLLADGSTLTNIMTATYENEAGWAFDPKTATDDTTINAPFWVLTKSDDPATVLAGEILTYTLSYYHNGLEVAQDVNITDTLPADVVYGGLVSQPAGWTGPTTDPGPPATLNWYRPTLAAGASGSMVFTVTVPSDAGGLITNQALLTSTTPTTYTMASEDTTVNTQADLSIEKSGDPAAVLAGETLTYTLTVDNAGPSDAQNVTVSDTLPADVTIVSVEPVTSTQTGQTVTWDLATLLSGESRTFTITVAVDPAVSAGSLVNNAEVSSTTYDPDLTYNTDSLTTPLSTAADLSIEKGGDPTTVVAGETLTYTLTVDNAGPSDAQNVTVTDTLPADVTIVSVEPVTSTQTGQTLTWDVTSLPNGESRTFTITVAVDPGASGSLVNNAEVASETDDPDPTYNTDSLTTPVNTEADLSIEKSGDPATVFAGETLTYTLIVDNAGPSDAQNVTVSDTLPAGTSVVSAEPTPSTQTGQTLTWDLTSLPSGESRTFTITVAVDPAASGSLVNNAEVSSETDDPDPTYNTDSVTTPVNTEADLAIQKSDDPDPVAAGATLVYTLVYTNYGPSDAQEVYLTDTLDANVTYGGVVSAPPVWGAPTYDPGPPATLTWYAPTLADEASGNIVFTVTVNADAIGTLLNSAAVTSSTPDDTTGNNSDVEDTDVGDPTRATIYGYVFADTNCNGKWDAGEQPIPGVTINLSGPGAPQDPATTRSDGLYFFVVDTPGVYSVTEQDPDGYYSTSPNEVHVNVALGNSYRVDFSDGQSETCAAIFGTVFEDLDSQGDWDALELGLEDVTITLNAGATALTDAYGAYTFPTTATGMHTVVETDPEGYMSTTPNEVDVDVALGNGYEVNFGDVQFCTCLGDAYEEDDDWTQAVELGVGVELSQAHDFCDDATDWTYFPARAGWIYTITTSSWGQRADTFLYLYDRDGQTLLAANDDYEDTDEYSSRIVWQPQYSGVYYILTANRAGLTGCQSDYDIWIEPLERGHIYLPVIMRSAKPPVTEPDETGPALVQELVAPATEIELEPNPPEVVEEVFAPSPPEVVEVVLAPRGIITHTCPDSYEVDDTWQEAKPVEDGVLQVHSFDSNPVEWAADKDFLSFYLESERTITFTVPTITGTATLLELHDDNGDSLNVTGTDELVWQSPADGTYYLSVSPRLAAYGCADVAGYELVANLSPREVVYLPLIMRSW